MRIISMQPMMIALQ